MWYAILMLRNISQSGIVSKCGVRQKYVQLAKIPLSWLSVQVSTAALWCRSSSLKQGRACQLTHYTTGRFVYGISAGNFISEIEIEKGQFEKANAANKPIVKKKVNQLRGCSLYL